MNECVSIVNLSSIWRMNGTYHQCGQCKGRHQSLRQQSAVFMLFLVSSAQPVATYSLPFPTYIAEWFILLSTPWAELSAVSKHLGFSLLWCTSSCNGSISNLLVRIGGPGCHLHTCMRTITFSFSLYGPTMTKCGFLLDMTPRFARLWCKLTQHV